MMVPASMGYALLAGLPPVYGLYTAFVPLLLYPLIGRSLHMIVGCAAIPSILTFSALSQMAEPFSIDYIQYAGILSLLCGIFLALFAFTGFGKLARFISAPVVLGYTLGAALVILLSQLKYLFQFDLPSGMKSIESVGFYLSNISDAHQIATLFGTLSLLMLILLKRIHKKIPGALVVMFAAIGISYIFADELIGLRLVGEIPPGLPSPSFDFDIVNIPLRLVGSAFVISFVLFVQSLSIAKTLSMKGSKERIGPMRELLGLSVSNLVGYVFNCYPVAGSLTRSAVNFDAGSKSGVSSMISGIVIFIILLFFTPLLSYLPFSVLAVIVIVAVFKFLDFHLLSQIFKHSKIEGIFATVTAVLTFLVNVQTGILAGVAFYLIHVLIQDKGLTKFQNPRDHEVPLNTKLRYYHLDEVQEHLTWKDKDFKLDDYDCDFTMEEFKKQL